MLLEVIQALYNSAVDVNTSIILDFFSAIDTDIELIYVGFHKDRWFKGDWRYCTFLINNNLEGETMMAGLFLIFFIAAILAVMEFEKASLSIAVINLVLCILWLNFHTNDTLAILL